MATRQQIEVMQRIKERFGDHINKVAGMTGLDKRVIYNLIYHESRGDSNAVGGAQDTGLTQLLPSTAVEIAGKIGYTSFDGEKDLKQQLIDNPGLNILFGAKYYSDQLKATGGNHALAYSRYNGGPSYRNKVDDDGGEWRTGVYDAIKSGDLSGTDEYSTHARDFIGSFSITGFDHVNNRPAQAPTAPAVDSRFANPLMPSALGEDQFAEKGLGLIDQLKRGFAPTGRRTLGIPFTDTAMFEQAASGVTEGGTSNWIKGSAGEPRGSVERLSRNVGHGLGMTTPFGLGGKLISKIPLLTKLAAGGKVAQLTAGLAQGSGAFALYEGLGRHAGQRADGAPLTDEDAGWLEKAWAEIKQRAPVAGKAGMVGGVVTAAGALPGVRKFAQGALTGPVYNTGLLAAMTTGEQALAGEKLTPLRNAEDAVGLAIGLAGGHRIMSAGKSKSIQKAQVERALEARAEVAKKTQEIMDEHQRYVDQKLLPEGETIYVEPAGEFQADKVSINHLLPAKGTESQGPITPKRQINWLMDEARAVEGEPGRGEPIRPLDTTPVPEPHTGTVTHRKMGGVEATEVSPQTSRGQRRFVKAQDPEARAEQDKRLLETAEDAALQGRMDLAVEKEMGRSPAEQNRLYEERRETIRRFQDGDVTTDMMGGQQVYEYLAGKAGEFKARRAASRERKIEAGALKIMQGKGFWDVLDSRPMFKTSSGGENNNKYDPSVRLRPQAGEPVTEVISRYWNDDISLEQMVREFANRPDMFDLPADAAAHIEALARKIGSGEMREVSGSDMSLDRRRFARKATGGEQGNPAYRSFMSVGEYAEMMGYKMEIDLRERSIEAAERVGIDLLNKKDMVALGKYLNAETRVESEKAISGAENPDMVLRMVPEARKLFEEQAQIRDVAEVLFGTGEPMPRRKFYFPQTERRIGLLENPGKSLEQWSRPEPPRALSAGPMTPKVRSAREMRRKGTMTEDQIEWDYNKAKGAYTADTVRKLMNSIALNSGENVVKELRARGLEPTANAMSAVNESVYNGRSIGQGDIAKQSRPGKVAYNVHKDFKQLWNGAKFTFSLPLAVTQIISTALIGAHGPITPKMVGRALVEYRTERVRAGWEASYTHFIKNQRRGQMLYEGGTAQDNLGGALAERRGKRIGQAAERKATWFNNSVENMTGRWAWALSEQMGKQQGIDPAKMAQFQSDVVGWTQSYYDRKNRAPMSSNPFFNAWIPAQGYAVEGFNSARSMARNETGGRRFSKKERAYMTAYTLANLYLTNMARTYMMNYSGDEEGFSVLTDKEFWRDETLAVAKNFMPYGSAIGADMFKDGFTDLGAMRRNATSSDILTQRSLSNLIKGTEQIFGTDTKDPNLIRGLSTIANEVVKGGGNAYRASEAQARYLNGTIAEEDLLMAMIWGWATTPSGKAYLNSRKGGGSQSSSGRLTRPTAPERPKPPNRARR